MSRMLAALKKLHDSGQLGAAQPNTSVALAEPAAQMQLAAVEEKRVGQPVILAEEASPPEPVLATGTLAAEPAAAVEEILTETVEDYARELEWLEAQLAQAESLHAELLAEEEAEQATLAEELEAESEPAGADAVVSEPAAETQELDAEIEDEESFDDEPTVLETPDWVLHVPAEIELEWPEETCGSSPVDALPEEDILLGEPPLEPEELIEPETHCEPEVAVDEAHTQPTPQAESEAPAAVALPAPRRGGPLRIPFDSPAGTIGAAAASAPSSSAPMEEPASTEPVPRRQYGVKPPEESTPAIEVALAEEEAPAEELEAEHGDVLLGELPHAMHTESVAIEAPAAAEPVPTVLDRFQIEPSSPVVV